MIHTRKVPATDTQGAKIRVHNGSRSLEVPYPFEAADPHLEAARLFVLSEGGDPGRFELHLVRATAHGDVYRVQVAETVEHDLGGEA
jgi:hypothetical protein